MIPDDLFRVVRGTSQVHGVIIFFIKIGDEGELISGEGVGIGVGRKGGEGSYKGGVHRSLGGDWVLKRGRHQ